MRNLPFLEEAEKETERIETHGILLADCTSVIAL
jgi:hypothetical protein